jgi:hypothetical protein
MYYIGLDVHKQKISFCVKEAAARYSPKDGYPPHALIWIAGGRRCSTGVDEVAKLFLRFTFDDYFGFDRKPSEEYLPH